MKRTFLGICACLLMVGCGYKPTTYYAKQALGESIYAEVTISRQDPQNTVLIKDSVNEAIVSRFGGRIVTKEVAETQLHVAIGSISFTPTVYDTYGYVIAYKANVVLNIKYQKGNEKPQAFQTTGEYDFSIEPNSIISDTKRFEAIRFAANDALDEFISKIAIKGLYHGNNHQ